MNHVFNDMYAHYYDLLYKDKDYDAEANFLVEHIICHAPNSLRILELGCGTGAHAEHLARMGYQVHGIDMSDAMLARAEERKAALPPEVSERLSFAKGDVRTVRTGETYDVVISLFHVMSYQASNSDFNASVNSASSHLAPCGLFLFDYWYGPAVLMQKPDVRVKRLEDNQIKVTRIAEPLLRLDENIVDVNYTLFIENNVTGDIQQLQETHPMRYFFIPELDNYLESQFSVCADYAWMAHRKPDADSWAALRVLRLT
jgi:SAM-dependent methyltransferase